MYRVYGDHLSGNCYKVKLLLQYLSVPYEWVDLDILKGDTTLESFRAKNPNAKIPLLQINETK